MRELHIRLIKEHLFEDSEDRKKLPMTDARFLEQVEFCFHTWFYNPRLDKAGITKLLKKEFGVCHSTSSHIFDMTMYAINMYHSMCLRNEIARFVKLNKPKKHNSKK